MFVNSADCSEDSREFTRTANQQSIELACTTDPRQMLVNLLPKLLLHARRLTRSQQLAEDLVQSTCVRAIDRLHQWGPEKRFEAWIVTIMKSIWLNDRRRPSTRLEKELEDPEDAAGAEFEKAANARLVLAGLRDLGVVSDDDFSLVMKIHVHGFTYKELAEELSTPIGTLLSRVSRTLNALRRKLQELHLESPA